MSEIATGSTSMSATTSSAPTEVGPNVHLPPTPSARLEINYLHHHIVTFSPEDGRSDTTTALQSLTSAIISNSAGKLHQKPLTVRNENTVPPSTAVSSISTHGRTIRYTSETLTDPPTLSYRTKAELEQLVKDWTDSSLMTIDGVGIPLCLWKNLYKGTRSEVWTHIKDQWTKFKFIVGGFKSFDTPEQFWEAMSVPPTHPETKRVNFKNISSTLRDMRIERDRKDMQRAKTEYTEKVYGEIFSYKKAGKVHVLTKPDRVARRYRLHNQEPVYWDELEDSDED